MKKLFKRILIIYLFVSCLVTAGYNLFPYYAWDIAENRNGFLCVGIDPWCNDYWILSPFDNYADNFFFGIQIDSDKIYIYSDTFDIVENFYF